MKVSGKRILDTILRGAGLGSEVDGTELPLRSELLSRDQMEQHGRRLAAAHRVVVAPALDQLLPRLAENESVLIDALDLLTESVKAGWRIAPAGEWLLDNFYLIEEQIRIAKRHLPKGYSRELPRLGSGPSAGLPRVYDIALETISHGDGRVDSENLTGFVAAYQSITSLRLGELWAIPIMLRLALIENLRRVAARILADRIDRNRAETWADEMMATVETDPKSLILVVADMARSNPPMSSAFVAELARRLQGQAPAVALPLTWVAQRLSESGRTIEQLIQIENQHQAADQVSISNSIGSLRSLSAMDWRGFVEAMSAVEQILREDPAGVYARMDFATRDGYRHVVERIGRRSRFSEPEIARQAIEFAEEARGRSATEERAAHVGHYLIGRGLPQLERAAGLTPSGHEAPAPLSRYLGPVMLVPLVLAGIALLVVRAEGWNGWMQALTALLALLAASQLAVSLVNWGYSLTARPRLLPKLDFSDGIPETARTLVAVPAMLTSEATALELLEALEVRYLANPDERLHFALLTDFADAPEERLAGDEAVVRVAAERIAELNRRYPRDAGSAFYLLHRPRQWNARERVWMGRERKRGKLADLNGLLRRGETEPFARIVGDALILRSVRYVLTLDSDTQLPRDTARECAAAMAHPLNRPRYDQRADRICEGFGILQPRVGTSLPAGNRSRYARLFGTDPGIDPYTRAVSDVYQDLFQEGSFIGKGIYDVEAFDQVLGGRLPDNRILSHDLLEGCHARAGLLTDVILFEEYPSRYTSDVSRRHRWIRGDWQLLGWLLPRVPTLRGRARNPLTWLSRWKLFDNLRRSLVPAALLLLLLLAWTLFSSPGLWTLAIVGSLLLPKALAMLLDMFRRSGDMTTRQHLATVAHRAAGDVAQAAFHLVCLPFEAFTNLDAVLRTLWRVFISRRRLLEWYASSEIERNGDGGLMGVMRRMWTAPATAVATFAGLAAGRPAALLVALPMLLLWAAAPAVAWWFSGVPARPAPELSRPQRDFLHRLARRTWGFFEAFVGPEDHWLPPDNFQEHPVPVLAHRTSPTNIGMSLLATLSAYDFGYLGLDDLIVRTGGTFDTLDLLERHRGHFYNWYDTRTLAPLLPRYVSTVDSGNLSAHLLTLRAGLLALPDDPVSGLRVLRGLRDTALVLGELLDSEPPWPLARFDEVLRNALAAPPATLAELHARLTELARLAVALAAPLSDAPRADEPDPWIRRLAAQAGAALAAIDWLPRTDGAPIPSLRELLRHEDPVIARRARSTIDALTQLADRAAGFAEVEFEFLYDRSRHLLAIGYNVGERRRDGSYYDLLASEARLTTFLGIAGGHLPQESWFAQGRLLASVSGQPVLMSWGGSMFEYLMPLLIMPSYEDTLLAQSCRAAVARQIEYGQARDIPWGMSESGYNAVDGQLNYQYRAFGVPSLGLKRGLAEDVVIAPYATAMALMIMPHEATANLERMADEGFAGEYGMYEAVDYTPNRLPRGQSRAIVQSYMAHHQGMSLLSFAWLLLDRPMQRRFESDPRFRATALLLQERLPRATAYHPHTSEAADIVPIHPGAETAIRVISSPATPVPEIQLLSNGRYHLMVTNAGGGYSRWKDLALTRWRDDGTRDHWGSFLYISDVISGAMWSAAHQPTLQRAESYEAILSEARVEFRRRDDDIETHTEIAVSPEDDIELRRITLTNRSRSRRVLEITSYAEVVLAPVASDALHPAFSNLFVQTEILVPRRAILCTRRPRSAGEPVHWLFHVMAVHGADSEEMSFETSRPHFLGRGNALTAPDAMRSPGSLGGHAGSVLDPVIAIRTRISLEPEQTATINSVMGISASRDGTLALIDKYQDRRLADRVFDLAWTHSQVVLRQLNATEGDAQLYGRLAGSVLFPHAGLRADPGVLARNRKGQSGLWSYAVSGDLPMVLLQITDPGRFELVRRLVQAHSYWRLKGLAIDLVIWNEDYSGYRQVLQEQIMGLIPPGMQANVTDRAGGLFVRPTDQIPNEDRILFQAVARVILTDTRGSLADQLARARLPEVGTPRLLPIRVHRADQRVLPEIGRDLRYFNGLGGFSADGTEYVIRTRREHTTPAPWVNVLANPQFGSLVSESGSAYTWLENAREFRLTPWHNDPVGDPSGEAFYLRDDESGHVWSATPLPLQSAAPYVTRHGFGYSVFEHLEGGIETSLRVFVAIDAPVKFGVLTVSNRSDRHRRLSATGYVEWVLGDLPGTSIMHVLTEVDAVTGALFARNRYHPGFGSRTAFFDVDDPERSLTCDRVEFLGRNGAPDRPAALRRTRLSGRTGPALDPCAALQVPFDLVPGASRTLVFVLGAGRDTDEARRLVQRYGSQEAARRALEAVQAHWSRILGVVRVETDDPAIDVLANGWLVYQTLACRLWARSGFYQSGGAFGFRDQLQDVMALVHAEPGLVREHLLRAAARQFVEGDVQHWWHPPTGRGVRTRCSDDYLWLPVAVCRYLEATGDETVLDEPAPFIEGRPITPEEDSYYDLPVPSGETGSLYEHCVRAIEHGLRFGSRGLPLMGSGDWNDGMNLVGDRGRGESVWLGFFLYDALQRFAPVAARRGDAATATRCGEAAVALQRALEEHGWDGGWYRRAYFDDGTPLGSSENDECRIDSISQSWSVLSGAGSPERAQQAMDALDRHLVRREERLVQLLDPPFDKASLDPGYIKGYVPGVRENGGQYTHAAIWASMAFAAQGDGARAWEILDLINPVRHATTAAEAELYKVEPYAVAADVYGVAPHTGRGGWTWYTGSAGWLYRLIVESLLGVRREGTMLRLAPVLRPDWKPYTVWYRFGKATYRIAVRPSDNGEAALTVDGIAQDTPAITLIDDGAEHAAELRWPAGRLSAIAPES